MKPRRTIKKRLTERLAALGFRVDYYMLARGYWSHTQQDVMRWTAYAYRGVEYVELGCWDTMTKCARQGIGFMEPGTSCQIEVYALTTPQVPAHQAGLR